MNLKNPPNRLQVLQTLLDIKKKIWRGAARIFISTFFHISNLKECNITSSIPKRISNNFKSMPTIKKALFPFSFEDSVRYLGSAFSVINNVNLTVRNSVNKQFENLKNHSISPIISLVSKHDQSSEEMWQEPFQIHKEISNYPQQAKYKQLKYTQATQKNLKYFKETTSM